MTKKTVPRNLQTDVKWELIDSFYKPVEEGTVCENCGRNISHIAKIGYESEIHFVGMDCAETLIEYNPLEHDILKYRFSEAESMRKRILKVKKTRPETKITYRIYPETEDGEINFANYFNGRFLGNSWKCFPAKTFRDYILPMLSNLGIEKVEIL